MNEQLKFNPKLPVQSSELSVRNFFDEQNIELAYYSEWLNAAYVQLDEHDKSDLVANENVVEVLPAASMNLLSNAMPDPIQLSFALEQIEGQAMINEGSFA